MTLYRNILLSILLSTAYCCMRVQHPDPPVTVCDNCVNPLPQSTCPAGKTCTALTVATGADGCLSATCSGSILAGDAGTSVTSLTCKSGSWVGSNGAAYTSAACAAECSGCSDIPQTTTPPTQVQSTTHFTYADEGGCKTATNGCEEGDTLRYVTSSGTKFIPPPDAQAQTPVCNAGQWEDTVAGEKVTVQEEVCYAARCADCPTPTVGTGVSVVISYNEDTWCKVATFSGCPNGYRYTQGSLNVNFNNPLTCADYGTTYGGRWFTPLSDNGNLVSCVGA